MKPLNSNFSDKKTVRTFLAMVLMMAMFMSTGCASNPAPADDSVQDETTTQNQADPQSDQESAEAAADSDSSEDAGQEASSDGFDETGCDENSQACDAPVKADSSYFTEMSFDEAIAFFRDEKSGILYFGFPDCPWCQEVVPILTEEAKAADVPVYYIRTRDDAKERLYTDEQRSQIMPYISGFMKENEDGEMTLYVPLVLGVINGQVVFGHQGTVDEHDATERIMTDTEKEEVREDMKKVISSQLPVE